MGVPHGQRQHLYEPLNRLEKKLPESAHRLYLFGKPTTEADIRLYVIPARSDSAYMLVFLYRRKTEEHGRSNMHL